MNSDVLQMRKAIKGDEERLTQISFASKRYWRYPEAYYTIWQSELTITADYLEENMVYVIADHDAIIGYYSVTMLEEDLDLFGQTLDRGYWLDHMFIFPDYVGRGIGKELFTHLCTICVNRRITRLYLLADPFAKGFYDKMGCRYIKEFSSTIEGRTTPLMSIDLELLQSTTTANQE